MKKRYKFFGIAAMIAVVGLSTTGCATGMGMGPMRGQPVRPRTAETVFFRAPWSAYTIIPSMDYVVVGAIALRDACNTTFLAELMERAIAMDGHDLINVRLAVTTAGRITGATAVVIRYIDVPVHGTRNPSWEPLATPPHSADATTPRTNVPPPPTQIVSVPWAAHTVLPNKNYVAVGAIVLRDVHRPTLLLDLKERAIEMGGNDIINVRLAVTDRGAITVATAVAIRYTDETVHAHAAAPVFPGATVPFQYETHGVQGDGPVAVAQNPARTPRAPSPPRAPRAPRPPRIGPHLNWLSGEVTILGAGIRYERDINDILSVGANISGSVTLPNNLVFAGGSGTARFFLANLPIYLELGLGVGLMAWSDENDIWGGGYEGRVGFIFTPAIGARLGGQTGRFFANPFVSFPIMVGAPVHFRLGVGLGGAW